MRKSDDGRIKKLVANYQSQGEGFEEIAGVLSDYIYSYPRLRFRQPEDVCGDFYLYFFERLEGVLKKYHEQECLFSTWFAVVLRRQYLNWLEWSAARKERKTYYLEDMYHGGEAGVYEEFQNPFPDGNNGELIREMIDSLPRKVKVAMKLYYFDFFEGKDLPEIAGIFDQNLTVLIDKYENILRHSVEQYDRERELLEKLNYAYSELWGVQEKLKQAEMSPGADENRLHLLNEKTMKYKDRHARLLDQYQRFHVSVKCDVICDFLGISANAVHNLVYRGKVLLKEKLEERR